MTDQDRQVIRGLHCKACGNTDPRDMGQDADAQGYTACCNKRAVAPYSGALRQVDCQDGLGCSHD